MPKISIPKGMTMRASDGNTYRWLGAQWLKVSAVTNKTSRIAARRIGKELTDRALTPKQKGNIRRLKKAYTSTKKGIKTAKKLSTAARRRASAAWFEIKVGEMARGFNPTKSLSPGSMYTFAYSAKHKKTLPYWDKFPLIVVLDVTKDGFLGLNFHYLRPVQREAFLNSILKFATEKGDPTQFSSKAQFNITWGAVKSIAGADKMIHKYLYSHVKSSMLESPPSEWENVIYMPYQKFVGESAKTIWSK